MINSVNALHKNDYDTLKWIKLDSSFEYNLSKHRKKSKIGSSDFFIIRLKPLNFQVDLIEYNQNKLLKTANFWTDSMNYNFIVNAGMYNLNNEKLHRFFMQNKGLINNQKLDSSAKGIIAFNPLYNTLPNLKLFDLTINKLVEIQKEYSTIFQGYRLIDNSGKPIYWERNDQICSMLVIAQDNSGFIYIVFSRSPLSQNEMIDNLLSLNLGLNNAIYLEGGSKASFAISFGDFKLKKVGSYVSNYYPFDNNYAMPKSPNFIGFKIVSNH